MFSFLTDYAEQFNHIVIEPFLTKKCNFKCRHCMYSCSPESSDEFMSIETFSKIEKNVSFIRKLGLAVVVNLLGGEPTLYWNKLREIVDIAKEWDAMITLPTNGWWVGNDKATKKFFDTFSDILNDPKKFSCCISDDRFHEEFRDSHSTLENFNKMFDKPEYSKFKPVSGNEWIVWQRLHEHFFINPQGRAKDISNAHIFIRGIAEDKSTMCWFEENKKRYPGQFPPGIHYEVDGRISSTCPFGNVRLGIGNIDDNVVYILALEKAFQLFRKELLLKKNIKYNCYNCTAIYNFWVESGQLERAQKLYSGLNTFDIKEFGIAYRNSSTIEYTFLDNIP